MNKYVIIIPTLNRSKYLRYSLETCLKQTYPNFEILISNNCSKDDTEKVILSYKDPRIRYIKTNKTIPMMDHWEFALEHVINENCFITYLGDDDGLLNNTVDWADRLISAYKVEALAFGDCLYFWPDSLREAGTLRKPIVHNNMFICNGKNAFIAAINFKLSHLKLPCIYTSAFIHTSVLRKARENSTNKRFFNAASPDVYSSFAASYFISKYLYFASPMIIHGTSQTSNGASGSIRGIFNENFSDSFTVDPSLEFNTLYITSIADAIIKCFDFIPESKKKFNFYEYIKVSLISYFYTCILFPQNIALPQALTSIKKMASRHKMKVYFYILYTPILLILSLYRLFKIKQLSATSLSYNGIVDVNEASEKCSEAINMKNWKLSDFKVMYKLPSSEGFIKFGMRVLVAKLKQLFIKK